MALGFGGVQSVQGNFEFTGWTAVPCTAWRATAPGSACW